MCAHWPRCAQRQRDNHDETTPLYFGGITFLGLAAYAKSLDFTLTTPTQAGSQTLAAGHYQGKITGDTAVFTGPKFKTFTVKLRAEASGEKKPNYDMFDFKLDDKGVNHLVSIVPAGTTSKLVLVD